MTTVKDTIPVFFSIDDQYAPCLAVALKSLICNANPKNNYRLIVLHQKLGEEHQKRLGALSTDFARVEFISMEGKLNEIVDHAGSRLRCNYFTLTIFFRLLIADMFPQYDKGIYIDSDIVVPADIAEMYQIDIADNLIGACSDLSIMEVPIFMRYLDEVIGVGGKNYINSGVLLLNMRKLREVSMGRRFLELFNKYHFDSVAPDQDYINSMCKGKIYYLPKEWDTMPNEHDPKISNPKLIHYNLFSKPWNYDHIQYEEYFWNYAKETDYYEQILAEKEAFDEVKIEEERRMLQGMLENAVRIMNEEVTFRKVFESGKEQRL